MRRAIALLAVLAAGLWSGGSLSLGGGGHTECSASVSASGGADASLTELAPQAALVETLRPAGNDNVARPTLVVSDDAPSPRPPAFRRPLRI